MAKPLFVIVHEMCVPFRSPQKKEINRIKQEERWILARTDLSLRTKEIREKEVVYVCGGYAYECVATYLLKLKKARGQVKATALWRPATISIREATNYSEN